MKLNKTSATPGQGLFGARLLCSIADLKNRRKSVSCIADFDEERIIEI